MATLNRSYRLRISEDDLLILKQLKGLNKKPTSFIRKAFREKIQKDLPEIIKEEEKRKLEQYCPF